ncbi:MAG: Coenzyme F420 hydrogenase/dehydrogenase, beta subunit C-terminal domain [Thermodesulfobacteriota bacterium]
MATTARLEVKNGDLLAALEAFSRRILDCDDIGAILAPWRLPMKNMVMPTLLTDPDRLKNIDPLSPAFPMNSAKVVSRITRKPSGSRVAALLRPCEIRAFHELVKLHQGSMEDLVIIGVDCLGAFSNRDYAKWVEETDASVTKTFYTRILNGKYAADGNIDLAAACRSCEFPVAEGADISIGLYGVDTSSMLLLEARTDQGRALFKKLDYPKAEAPAQRKKAVEELVAERTASRDRMLSATSEATDSLEKLAGYLASCVNCYNCRVACPVCYCRECVFVTDVFDHDSVKYLRWAERRGAVKMPTDTVLYHITRMVHMSTACVGCGQCSNACPNDIPVMELFRWAAQGTQSAFDYEAGRSLDEKPPMSEFREEEFEEVVGLGS